MEKTNLETYQPSEEEQDASFTAEQDKEYEDWYNNVFSKMSEEEQRKELLRLVKKEVSEEDGKVLDRIIELLTANPDGDTDMVFFMKSLPGLS